MLIDQIGDPLQYDISQSLQPNVSQLFPDFVGFDSLVLEDFQVGPDELTVRTVQVLFEAGRGFENFDLVEQYHLAIFDNPNLASTSLLGNIETQVLTVVTDAVSVIQVGDSDVGLVTLSGEWDLPAAGQFWVGVAPVAPSSLAGQFFLLNSGAAGVDGGTDGIFANPEEGFGAGSLLTVAADFAVLVSTEPIPEPSTGLLVGFFSLACCFARKR